MRSAFATSTLILRIDIFLHGKSRFVHSLPGILHLRHMRLRLSLYDAARQHILSPPWISPTTRPQQIFALTSLVVPAIVIEILHICNGSCSTLT